MINIHHSYIIYGEPIYGEPISCYLGDPISKLALMAINYLYFPQALKLQWHGFRLATGYIHKILWLAILRSIFHQHYLFHNYKFTLTWRERTVRINRTAATTKYFSLRCVNRTTLSITLFRRKLDLR